MPRIPFALMAVLCISVRAQVPGVFDRAALLREHYAAAAPNPVYTVLPITVELRARIAGTDGYNILVANEPKNSVTHWELFTEPRTGRLCAFWPGFKPDHVRSTIDIADGRWRAIAMSNDGTSIALYVDGREVAREKVEKVFRYPDVGPLYFGHVEGVADIARTGVAIDEVRISRIVRDLGGVGGKPLTSDNDTVALWHFDGDGSPWRDFSPTNNPVRTIPRGQKLPAVTGVNVQSNRWAAMDHGPFFSSTLGIPGSKSNTTLKAVTVRLGKDSATAGGVAFDTELLRVSAAWLGGFVKLHPGREGLAQHPDAAAAPMFETTPGPGWAVGDSVNFADPRPEKLGPLPPDAARYKGLYLHGDRTIFSYSVGATEILETFDLASGDGQHVIVRTIEAGPSNEALACRLLDVPGATGTITPSEAGASPHTALFHQADRTWAARLANAPSQVGLEIAQGGRFLLRLPPRETTTRVRVALWQGNPAQAAAFARLASALGPAPDLAALAKGGPARWGEPLVTRGTLGDTAVQRATDNAPPATPYVVDTLTAPEDNPFKSFLRFGGHDFFANGDLAACSVSGDVWIVSGIDDKLERLAWKRFATGLHQPLGLRILNDKVYVLGRDQITRLHDLNDDGEADFYENFNNGCKTTSNGHAYATNLETDPQGNFYFTKCADNTEFGGTLVKVSADGKTAAPYAVGLRNPNGAGVSPSCLITVADNQGEWIPASRLDVVEPGEFLGYKPMAKGTNPKDMGRPLCFMPQNIDNSSGGQVWVTSDRWGPFKGDMLHTSYGGGALLHVMMERVDGAWQGGVTRFPLKFETGIMRGRFSPRDGQLYLSGLRGWQTVGHKPGALHRVRYTGASVHTPTAMSVHQNGILLSFAHPLDRQSAADPDNYGVLRWTYKWTGDYPSRQWSVENPKKQGHDVVEVTAAKVSADARQVFLEVPDIAPVLQQRITMNIRAADGTPVREDIHHTIHALRPPWKGD